MNRRAPGARSYYTKQQHRSEEETHRWLAIGAPPVGSVEDFGAYVVADED